MTLLGRTLQRLARRLRFPWLFALTALLFGVDLVVPDALPLVDELLLGLTTLLLGSWRERKKLEKGSGGDAAGEDATDEDATDEGRSGER